MDIARLPILHNALKCCKSNIIQVLICKNIENIFQMVNSVTEVTEGCILEVVFKSFKHQSFSHHFHLHSHRGAQVVMNTAPLGDEEVEIRPHSLSIHSYKTPTFCRS